MMKSLTTLFILSIFLISTSAEAKLFKLKGDAANQELIQALLLSGVKTGGKVGYKAASLKDLSFERLDGTHFTLTPSSQEELKLKETDQLYTAIQNTLVAQLAKQKLSTGDCSAGHCTQSWNHISCRWKMKTQKISSALCTFDTEVDPL